MRRGGQYLDAAREFATATHIDPSEENLFVGASELLLRRAYPSAIEVFRNATGRFPKSSRLWIGLGMALYSRGEYEDSVHALLTASDLDPRDPRCYVFLSKAYLSAPTQANEVIKHFQRYAELDPRNPVAHYDYALSLWKGRRAQSGGFDSQAVEALLRRAISLDGMMADETLNNFADVPPQHPTVFEYFRKDLNRPLSKTWVVAPSNGFNRIGESDAKSYGPGTGARVILPKQLLKAASSGSAGDLSHLLHDNYEGPLYTPHLGGGGAGNGEVELQQLDSILKLSVNDFMAHARSAASPDELSIYIAKQLMREQSPSLLWITMHDIDIAHTGAYSLYIEAIQRTDRLCAELWRAIQSDPEYAGNTILFILPDFGRDSDEAVGGNGFLHHRTDDASSRTTWMMALGAGVREGVVYDHPVESIDLVPTLGAMMGFSPKLSRGHPIRELL